MGKFLLLAVLMVLLAGGYGANAARLYTTNEQVKAKESSNLPSFLLSKKLLGQFSPLDAESGSAIDGVAQHYWTPPGASDQGYYGFIATMDVYAFNLSSEQFTTGLVILSDQGVGPVTSRNVVQIGWEISPKMYGDSHIHLGGLWTTDGYHKTGCPNTDCGFQPEKGAPIALGGIIGTVSQLNGLKQTITIKIIKEGIMGDWLVYYGLNQDDPALVGRYPKALFTGGMADRASTIQLGGYVQTRTTNLTPMGSGYLPTGDAMASASMSNIQFIDQNGAASLVTQDSPTDISDSRICQDADGLQPSAYHRLALGVHYADGAPRRSSSGKVGLGACHLALGVAPPVGVDEVARRLAPPLGVVAVGAGR
nr:uncharacterized protein LOC127325853 [Lolium perenne]